MTVTAEAITKALKTNRAERFRYELLDRFDNFLGEITTVLTAQVTANVFNTIRTGGIIELWETGEINYYSDRIRIMYGLLVNGAWVEWPLGVFLLGSSGRHTDGKSVLRRIECYDKLIILHQDILDTSYTVAEGVKVTAAVRTVIQGAGETKINITPSEEELPVAKTWPPGTSRLQIVNDLLSSVNYFSLYVDGEGFYRGDPYVSLSQRPLVWTFADDKEGLYEPELNIDADFFSVPNKVILVVSNPDQELLVSTVTNEDPSSPFSYQSRGRWITDFRESEEATSQAVLDSKAQRIMQEAQQVLEAVEYRHAWVPLALNEVVEFKNQLLDMSARYVVVRQDYNCMTGEVAGTRIRRVIT